jgi:hypothetical protein
MMGRHDGRCTKDQNSDREWALSQGGGKAPAPSLILSFSTAHGGGELTSSNCRSVVGGT